MNQVERFGIALKNNAPQVGMGVYSLTPAVLGAVMREMEDTYAQKARAIVRQGLGEFEELIAEAWEAGDVETVTKLKIVAFELDRAMMKINDSMGE